MINCRNVAKLLGTEELGDRPFWVRLRVKLHLAMCRHCRRLAWQLRQLGAAARGIRESFDAEKRGKDDLEDRLCRKLGLERESRQTKE